MFFGIFGKFRIDIEKNPCKNRIFQDKKVLSTKSKKYFSRPKNFRGKIDAKVNEKCKFRCFPKKIEILKFPFFIDFSEDFFSENFLISKNIFSTFSRKFFDLEIFYFCVDFFLYQSEIFSGIQKSYLENRTII